MRRFHQLLFVPSLLALCWLTMMAVHELGHVIGGVATGGRVQRVTLRPLTISRTDVSPNPHPAIVAWLGPILGCVFPVVGWLLIPRRLTIASHLALFFAGFCLLANGAYIAFGSFARVGDCGEMLRAGSPFWTLIAFGAFTLPLGLCVWHFLGFPKQFLYNPSVIPSRTAYLVLFLLLGIVLAEFAFSSR